METCYKKIKHEDYDAFVEKFKPKKTTDDCYTPPEVDRLKKQAEEKDEELNSALKKAKEAGADENVVMLKFKFSNLQATANDLLDLLDKVRQSDSATAEKLALGIAQTLTRYAERMKNFD